MREYIFVLGREPELSYLELISYFISQEITYKLIEYENDITIFLLQDLDFDVLIKRLGGTVKIAEVFFAGNLIISRLFFLNSFSP